MVLITSQNGLAVAKTMVRLADKKGSLIIGNKSVSKAMENAAPIMLLLATDDGSCSDHRRYATEHNVPVVVLPSRTNVGEFVGRIGCKNVVVCCVLSSFVDLQAVLARLLLLG